MNVKLIRIDVTEEVMSKIMKSRAKYYGFGKINKDNYDFILADVLAEIFNMKVNANGRLVRLEDEHYFTGGA